MDERQQAVAAAAADLLAAYDAERQGSASARTPSGSHVLAAVFAGRAPADAGGPRHRVRFAWPGADSLGHVDDLGRDHIATTLGDLSRAGATLDEIALLLGWLRCPEVLTVERLRALRGRQTITPDQLARTSLRSDPWPRPGRPRGVARVVEGFRRGYDGYPAELDGLWPDAVVADFVLRHRAKVAAAVRADLAEAKRWGYSSWPEDPGHGFRLLALLPELEPDEVELVVGEVFTGRRTAPDARAAAERVPGIAALVAEAIGHPRAEVRTEAARWAGGRGDRSAEPALRAAVQREKQDVALGAQLDALVALGADPATLLDRQELEERAGRQMARGLPAALADFPVDALLPLRWADTGEPVPRVLVEWLLAQAVKGRSSVPGTLARHLGHQLRPEDRTRAAAVLLHRWMSGGSPLDPFEVRAQVVRWATEMEPTFPRSDPAWRMPWLDEQVARQLEVPRTADPATRGLLALVAAWGDDAVVAPVERFLTTHYGWRASACRSLVVVLAHVDGPRATQHLLAVAARFRTKGIREEALTQAARLAERRGWSVDELADRTLPTAGLDDAGTATLDLGGRTFTVRLHATYASDPVLALEDEGGRQRDRIPDPAVADDPDLVAAARRDLAAQRKQLKVIVAQQRSRWYDAMCSRRSWTLEGWRRDLLDHVVARPLVCRLLWQVEDGDGERTVVRPTCEGLLLDVHGASWEPPRPDTAVVRLAHTTTVATDEVVAWKAHLAAAGVEPLFLQLGRVARGVPAAEQDGVRLTTVVGHRVDARRVRSRARSLGWRAGQAIDGPEFYTWEKSLPGLDLTLVLQTTATPVEVVSHEAVLGPLEVHSAVRRGPVPLAGVGDVLLTEARADLLALAVDGPGYDPDWRLTVTEDW